MKKTFEVRVLLNLAWRDLSRLRFRDWMLDGCSLQQRIERGQDMRREEVSWKRIKGILASLFCLVMLVAGLPAGAADLTVSSPVYNAVELPAGDDLTVTGTGLISVDGEDVEYVNANPGSDTDLDNLISAVRGDGTVSDFVYNSTVTIQEGGEITATVVYNSAETLALPNNQTYVRGIDADEGELTITNAGTITASLALNEAWHDAHAMGIQVHNYNTSTLLNPMNLISNSGSIFATAINYNSAFGEATARGIQVGGTYPDNTPADLGNLTVDNSGNIAAEASGYNASSRAIKIGGADDAGGAARFYNTTIINDGTLSATTTAGDSGSAWVLQSGGYHEGLTVTNYGDMLANVSSSATATDDYENNYADANARVIKVGEQMTDLNITNDGTMVADAFTVGDETASSISANSRGIHIGRDNDTVSFLNNGTMTVNAEVLGEDGLGDYLSYSADANASAFHMGYNSASVSITNTNIIDVDASITANSDGSSLDAGASGVHTGGQGLAEANEDFTFDNSGELSVMASVTADERAYYGASASASGVHLGTVLGGSLTNSGLTDVTASAYGVNSDWDMVSAHAEGFHVGDQADGLDVANSGMLTVDATAEGFNVYRGVSASARGMKLGYENSNIAIDNQEMVVTSFAVGEGIEYYHSGDGQGDTPYTAVSANARGIQVGYNSSNLNIVNDNMIVSAAADGSDLTHNSYNDVHANARGIQIGGEGASDIAVTSQTLLDVRAFANASDAGDVSANARGIKIGSDTFNEVQGVDLINNGEVFVLAEATGGGIYSSEANAKGIHLGDDFTDVNIENNLLQVTAKAIQDGGNAHAWGIQTGYNVTTLGIDNTGGILVDATATEEANATGVKLGYDNQGTISNAGTIAATATSLTDYQAHARGIHVGYNSAGGMVDIINETGATLSAIATSTFGNTVGAYGIQTGGDIVGLITNHGTIQAVGSGGDGSKAIGVQGEGSMALDNFGDILVDLQVEDADYVQGSRAFGVSAPDGDKGREAAILNAAGGTIQVNADYNLGDSLDGNSGAFGIRVAEYGVHSIENAGDIVATASIFAGDDIYGNLGAFGIRTSNTYFDSDLNDISNSGTITATSTIESLTSIEDNAGAFGIRSGYTGGGNTNVVNEASGTIGASASLKAPEMFETLGAFGIRIGDDGLYAGDGIYNAAVLNQGTILVDATIDTDYVSGGENFNRGAFGIRTGTSLVVNEGVITAAATMDGANDSAYDGAYGIRTGHGQATVVNAGSIDVSLLDNDASTTQRAVGIMTGQDGNEIHQSGSITATATGGDAYSVVMGCDEGDTIVPALRTMRAMPDPNALLILDGAAMVGDVLNASPYNKAFVAFGLDSVDGRADFGTEYADAAEYIYAIDASSGDLQAFQTAIYNGVTVDPDFSFTFNDDFVGEQGWKALLAGGSTILNNSAASTIEGMVVGSQALLGGNAHVGDLTAFGDLAPGDGGTGTITIDEDLYQGPESTFFVEAGDGDADRIDVSGYAYVEDGATVNVSTIGYVADGSYTIMTAAGDMLYNSVSLVQPDSLTLFYTLDADDSVYNTVVLHAERSSYQEAGVVSNGSAAGKALVDAASQGDPQASALVALLDSTSDLGLMQEILGSLAPEQYPSFLDLSALGYQGFSSGVSNNLGTHHLARLEKNRLSEYGPILSRQTAFDRDASGWSTWGQVVGRTGEQDRDGDLQGYEFDTTSIALGFDNKLNDNLVLGLAFGFGNTDADFDNFSQTTDMDAYYGSLYGTYKQNALYIDTAFSVAASEFDSERNLVLGPVETARATSSTDGTEVGLYLGGGYYLIDTDTMYFAPTASLSWSKVDIDGFTESGAGSFNLDVDDYDSSSAVTTLGFRFGGKMGMVEPELRLAWAHDFGDDDREVTVKYVGGPTEFRIQAVEPDMDSALVGLGAKFLVSRNFTLYIDYDGEIRSDYDSHALSAGLRYDF